MRSELPIICLVAPSGTGKSTAIERLIPELVARGLRVGVLKHDAHRLTYDTPGKDTWRFRQAGAWRAVIAGDSEVAVFSTPEPPADPRSLARRFLGGADIVLAEGYRAAGLPCIRVHRAEGPAGDGWVCPPGVVGWFSDEPLEQNLPVVSLHDPAAQADFILGVLRVSSSGSVA